MTGVTPLLRKLLGVPGPASCSLKSDEPVLPLNEKEYSDFKMEAEGFPGGAVVESPPANAGDMGLSPGPGRSHMPRSN